MEPYSRTSIPIQHHSQFFLVLVLATKPLSIVVYCCRVSRNISCPLSPLRDIGRDYYIYKPHFRVRFLVVAFRSSQNFRCVCKIRLEDVQDRGSETPNLLNSSNNGNKPHCHPSSLNRLYLFHWEGHWSFPMFPSIETVAAATFHNDTTPQPIVPHF